MIQDYLSKVVTRFLLVLLNVLRAVVFVSIFLLWVFLALSTLGLWYWILTGKNIFKQTMDIIDCYIEPWYIKYNTYLKQE